jgi:hypothetical protein
MPETPQSLIAYCREHQRVCPLPQSWNTLFEMLPNRHRTAVGWEPALPLILEAWDTTPGPLKTLRLAEHIEWAAANGALDTVAAYLRGLREDQWLHA